jgi:hypothetical protein
LGKYNFNTTGRRRYIIYRNRNSIRIFQPRKTFRNKEIPNSNREISSPLYTSTSTRADTPLPTLDRGREPHTPPYIYPGRQHRNPHGPAGMRVENHTLSLGTVEPSFLPPNSLPYTQTDLPCTSHHLPSRLPCTPTDLPCTAVPPRQAGRAPSRDQVPRSPNRPTLHRGPGGDGTADPATPPSHNTTVVPRKARRAQSLAGSRWEI